MRETNFIQQNKEKWSEFEKSFENERDPEKVSNLFIQITDDLSYSRTYYPNRSVKIYLNSLAQKVFNSIYKNKIRRRKKFSTFWKEDLPKYMYEVRWQLLFAFSLFMLSFFIGIFSSMHDPQFARFILGDDYVKMTEENIASGNPMKVYKDANQFDMFFGITLNNLYISFLMLMLGIFFGVGTIYFIIYNGIMVGVFQYFFIERGLFAESFLTIWVHGALEICAIVIAATAGITLGKGFLFPGTLTRLQSFRANSVRAIQIFLGIAPIIVLAAINESFLTRYTETPDFVRAILIITEFGFMFFYFVLYPARKAKAGFKIIKRSDEIVADKTPDFRLNKIKSNGEIFSDGFLMLKHFIAPILTTVFILSAFYCVIYFLFVVNFSDVYHMTYVGFGVFDETSKDISELLSNNSSIILYLLNTISLTIILSLSFHIIKNVSTQKLYFKSTEFVKFLFSYGWFIFILSALLHGILLFGDNDFSQLLFFLLLPCLCLIITDTIKNKRLSFKSSTAIKYYFKNFLNIQLFYLTLLLLSMTLTFLAHSGISYFNSELIKWNIPFNAKVYEGIEDTLTTFIFVSVIFLQTCMIAINMGLMYFSMREVNEADDLKSRIQLLGDAKSYSA